MKTLPVEQLQSFLREAGESGVFELYYLELATGLRRGELLGLKWEDIDLERDDLRVKRQVVRINGVVTEAPLKTKNAYRTLPLAEDTVSVLKEQKKKAGSSPWVFPSPNGGPISPDSVLHMLHRVLKRAGLPGVRFHDLRHTFATLALTKRSGCENRLRHAGPLQRRVYPGHLRPCDHLGPAAGGESHGTCPLRQFIALSSPEKFPYGSESGSDLKATNKPHEKVTENKNNPLESGDSSGFLAGGNNSKPLKHFSSSVTTYN